jgi:hypothetical protein
MGHVTSRWWDDNKMKGVNSSLLFHLYGIHDWWQSDVDVQLSLQWLTNDYKSFDMNINKLNPPPTYLQTYLPIYLPPPINQPTCLLTHETTYLPPIYPPTHTHPSIYLPIHPPTYFVNLPIYLPTCFLFPISNNLPTS